MQSPPRPPLLRDRGGRALLGASAAAALAVVVIGVLGTLGVRAGPGRGRAGGRAAGLAGAAGGGGGVSGRGLPGGADPDLPPPVRRACAGAARLRCPASAGGDAVLRAGVTGLAGAGRSGPGHRGAGPGFEGRLALGRALGGDHHRDGAGAGGGAVAGDRLRPARDHPGRQPLLERRAGDADASPAGVVARGPGGVRGHPRRAPHRLVPFAVVVAVRQLLRWRASMPLVAAMLLAQTVAIQLLFFTRW